MKLKFNIFYFVQYFSLGIIGPYLAVYLNEKAFSGGQIGLLLGSMPIVMIVCQPVWSYLSDLMNTRRVLLLVGCLGVAVASIGLGAAETFPIAFLWALLFSAMRAPIAPVGNAAALDYLEESGRPGDYSLVRLWGSFGFGVSSMLLGGLFLDQIVIYFTWFLAVMYLLLAGLSLLLPERREALIISEFSGLQFLRQNPNFTVFLLASVFIGGTMGIYNAYMTLFLKSIHASSWLIGLTVSLQALLEIPMMMVVPFLLTRFSMRRLIAVGAIALPIRWILYFIIRQPGWIVPTQLLHGIAIVSFFVVGVTFIDQHISPKWRATGQGLYSTALSGIGTGVGVYLAGIVFERFEIRSIWLLTLVLGLIGLALLLYAFNRLAKMGG